MTMRSVGKPAGAFLDLGIDLQAKGATTCLRTHGTLRVTWPTKVTPQLVREIRVAHPLLRVYTDTPLNAWAAATEPVQRQPVPEGKKLIKISADYFPHPKEFHAVAAIIGGTIHQVRSSKYTDKPMACLCAVPSSFNVSEWDTAAHQFSRAGLWYVQACGTADV